MFSIIIFIHVSRAEVLLPFHIGEISNLQQILALPKKLDKSLKGTCKYKMK